MDELDYSQYTDDDDEFEEISYDETIITTPVVPAEVTTQDITEVTEYMIVCYLAASEELWIRCIPVIDPQYFNKEYMPVIKLLIDYETKNHLLPNPLVILGDTGIKLEVPSDAHDIAVIEDMSQRVEDFCRHRAAADFLIASADIISDDKSKSTMSFLVTEMERISQISVHQDFGFKTYDDVEELLAIAEKSDALPTGFDLLDEALNGGVTSPSYNLLSASTGGGKSIGLQNLAVNYSRQGHNVVYFSLELPEFMVEKRFAAMITNTPINSIYQNMGAVIMKMRAGGRKYGNIQIKRFPMNGTTIADIKAFVHELETVTGDIYSHVMIDYPDLMKPMNPNIREDNIHLRDQAISVDIYDWAHDKKSNKTIWGASQQVKGAKDEKDARQSGVSGGVGKVNTCDNLIIFKRSNEDLLEGICWAHIEKGRNGGTGNIIPIKWDTDTQRMTSPMEIKDMYEKQPESKHKSTHMQKVDPIARAKAIADTKLGRKTAETTNKIKNRNNVRAT